MNFHPQTDGHLSIMSLTLYKIPEYIFSGKTPQSVKNQEIFKDILNAGYDKVKHKYRVIETSRIEHTSSFLSDLSFKADKRSQSFIYAIVANDKITEPKTRIESDWWKSAKITDTLMVKEIKDENFEFVTDLQYRVLATAGYKPVSDTEIELTAFTSFYPYAGVFVFSLLVSDVSKQHQYKTITAEVVQEHQLYNYYTKTLNFDYVSTTKIVVDTMGYCTSHISLSNKLRASRNFHLDKYTKQI